MEKSVYHFGAQKSEGDAKMKSLLGGKGANLAEMSKIGINVPPGFTITTAECIKYYQNGNKLSKSVTNSLKDSILQVEKTAASGAKFGDENFPMLFSVRSGAPVSMPGMMDTILNLGLNDKTVIGIARKTENKRFAMDSYRRFIQMYSDVVLGVEHHHFETILDDMKLELGIKLDTQFSEQDFEKMVILYKNLVKEKTGSDFPSDVWLQLEMAIEAVFKSWMNERAIYYRKMHNYSADMGTAVTVQSMVFGNLGETSGTGVAFTRNPSTGEKKVYGEYLLNAQGEDVVAGIRTPYPIDIASKTDDNKHYPSLQESMPEVYQEFIKTCNILENHYSDMQDIEFTIQDKKLWILQTRSGKRTAKAAVKIAYDLVMEGKISKKDALLKIEPKSLDQLLHKSIDKTAKKELLDKGLPASPGAACGNIALSCKTAIEMVERGKKVILTRLETSPEDIEGMNISEGILTSRGGMTSHAAVVARGMGRPCVTSAKTIVIDYKTNEVRAGKTILKEGDVITIDGSTGEIFLGEVETVEPEISTEFAEIMKWAHQFKKLQVRTNAETPKDAKEAIKFGCQGIGLCRTEHMFFSKDRILNVRKMILSTTTEQRENALKNLLPYQIADFEELFEIMEGLPLNIRLLDPPLHEFLPQKQDEFDELATAMNISYDEILHRTESLHEQNPMLGHRGCRLGITYPEIYKMQAEAIFSAASNIVKKGKKQPILEVMIPLVFSKKELEILGDYLDMSAKEKGISYKLGTMIELPRAALMAGEIAERATYFSFGTNDLTQTTFGISRDDSSSFISAYEKKGIINIDPFVSLDLSGVGRLIEIAVSEGRKTRPDIKLGICGEHGGDPASIEFCHKVGMDYVSCSPFRIPTAILAAAQACLKV